MKKLILLLLPAAIFLAACSEPAPPPPQPKPVAKHKAKAKSKSDNPEEFRAVEKPSSYGQ
jgi:hypothetical protein